MRFLLYLYKCSRCGFIHCMWWWLCIQYFQLDFSHLVDEALSLCSCTFVYLDIVDFDVKLFYYDSWWLILCFLYSCSWLLLCFWRFCAACDVVGNVYLIILKSNVQLFLPHQLSVISFAKLSALVNGFSDIDGQISFMLKIVNLYLFLSGILRTYSITLPVSFHWLILRESLSMSRMFLLIQPTLFFAGLISLTWGLF